MKNIKQYIVEAQNPITTNFIKEMKSFLKKSLSNKNDDFDVTYKINGNNINIELDNYEQSMIYDRLEFGCDITVISDAQRNNYHFNYLPSDEKNIFMICFSHSTHNTDSNGDLYLMDIVKKKNRKLFDTLKPYKGFERGHWDEAYEVIYPITDEIIGYLKEAIIAFLDDYKEKLKKLK